MREKEELNQIIDEADEYKLDFYQKRKIACDKSKAANREKEKVSLQIIHLNRELYTLCLPISRKCSNFQFYSLLILVLDDSFRYCC